MQVKRTKNNETSVTLSIIASEQELVVIKEDVLQKLAPSVKLAGFRGGKAPLALVEKQVNPTVLQNDFIDAALQQLYIAAIKKEDVRVVAPPKVEIKKYVPFSTLEFDVTLSILGDVKLGDYKKLHAERQKIAVTAKEVTDVLESLRLRTAEKKDVTRASKTGDQVWIDFEGKDASGKAVQGADGKDYPLSLGSSTFIKGFEENVIGLKAGQDKTFTVPFPKDYRIAALQGKKVTFTVHVTKVQEVMLPKLDDEFASKTGPVKTLQELKDDIKKQLHIERQQEADRNYEVDLVNQLVAKSSVEVPDALVEQQIESMVNETKQNLMYRSQTWQEYLKELGKTEEEYDKDLQPVAEQRVRTGLVLGAVADTENIQVTEEEIAAQIQALKGRYTDAKMQAELDKPEARSSIASRILTEKTIQVLVSFADAKK